MTVLLFNVMTGCYDLADIPYYSATRCWDTERVELSLPPELLTALLPAGSQPDSEEE